RRFLGPASDRDTAADKSPNFILRLAIIERSKLPRQRHGQKHQSASFYRSLKMKAGAKRGDIGQPGNLVPAERSMHPNVNAHRQRQRDSLNTAAFDGYFGLRGGPFDRAWI